MKVLLLQDIENVGKKFEIKEVKNGYARNLLIPQNLVKLANRENLTWLKAQQEVIEKISEEDLKKAQEMASKLDDIDVLMMVKAHDGKKLFESITASKITDKLKEMGFEVKKSHVILVKPIKELGEYPVTLKLDHNLEAVINVVITEELGEKIEEQE